MHALVEVRKRCPIPSTLGSSPLLSRRRTRGPDGAASPSAPWEKASGAIDVRPIFLSLFSSFRFPTENPLPPRTENCHRVAQPSRTRRQSPRLRRRRVLDPACVLAARCASNSHSFHFLANNTSPGSRRGLGFSAPGTGRCGSLFASGGEALNVGWLASLLPRLRNGRAFLKEIERLVFSEDAAVCSTSAK